jgi:type II secretory pathway pseudopilin PulG
MRVIELLVGAVVLGGVTAIAVPVYTGIASSAESSATRTAVQQALSAQQRQAMLAPDGQLAGVDQQLTEALNGVDLKQISDRISGRSYILAESGNGDIWVGDTATGSTRQINEQIRTALDDAGITPEQLAGGELGRLLDTLNTGTQTQEQIAVILGN